jgi:hypothetical protein
MMNSLVRLAFIAYTLTAVSRATAGDSIGFSEGAAVGAINVQADPPVGDWPAEPAQSGQPIESTGGYRAVLHREAAGDHAVWSLDLVRTDARQFKIDDFSYEVRTPLGRVAAVFDSQSVSRESLFRRAPQLDAVVEVRPNRGVPLMMACDHYGNGALAAGAMDQTGTYRITGRRDGGDYSILIARDEYAGDGWFVGKQFRDAAFISTAPQFWYDAACAFAAEVDRRAGYQPLPIPAAAELPYYSTWYALRDKLDERAVWAQAERAAQIGCGTMLIFIGWDQCEDWFDANNAWGDYDGCETRFADFAGLVERMQTELDMAVEVWTAPTWIGAGSRAFERVGQYRSKWPGGDYDRNLDPRSPAARRHIEQQFQQMAERLGVDGYYVDFADTIFNRNDAPHEKDPNVFGVAYQQYLAAMYRGFTASREEAIAEFRMPFANLVSKPAATVFNTSYNDGDWRQTRMFAIANRYVGRGVVNRTDPLTFTGEELNRRDEAGKALSAMLLLGPPGISTDLTQLDEQQLERLGRWLAFYREHREDILQGSLRPFGEQYHEPEMMVHRGDTAYAWVSRWETGEIPFPAGTKNAYLFIALPEEVSFIARVHLGQITGLAPGKYRARWVDSSQESHQGWFEFEYDPTQRRRSADPTRPIRSPRENWDFHPDEEGVPSLDVRRGGFLELHHVE